MSSNFLGWRWLGYALIIVAPAGLAWKDFFTLTATQNVDVSLLAEGTVSSYTLFAVTLTLPLLYVAIAKLPTPRAQRTNPIPLLYLFAAFGYLLDMLTFAALAPAETSRVLYLWVGFLVVVYLPAGTAAAVLLSSHQFPKRTPQHG